MNYNISDFVNRSYILNQTSQNKSKETQILLLFISTALKQSLALYEIQWKSSQINRISTNQKPQTIIEEPKQKLIEEKKAQEKPLNKEQQNKNCVDQKSYNQKLLPNHQAEALVDHKPVISHQNNLLDEHKEIRTTCEYPQIKRIKIIHQNLQKQHYNHVRRMSSQNLNFIDLYQPAYIPKDHFTNKQIREKREKLLERRVHNWKQIDKKVGFRKMQLKKLLT